jgi:hypothetical protein
MKNLKNKSLPTLPGYENFRAGFVTGTSDQATGKAFLKWH